MQDDIRSICCIGAEDLAALFEHPVLKEQGVVTFPPSPRVPAGALELPDTDVIAGTDIVFADAPANDASWLGIVRRITEAFPDKPVIVVFDALDPVAADEALDNGAFDFLVRPLSPETLSSAMLRVRHHFARLVKQNQLIDELETSENRLLEQNTIFDTILNLLSHDTRNLFINVKSLIQQLPGIPEQVMLADSVDELHDAVNEAVGYLGAKKRIVSVLEMVREIHITRDRIPIGMHARIDLVYSDRHLLYAEVGALFKNAVINVIENALKYTPAVERIMVSIVRKSGWIEIAVADRGPGIPDAEKLRVFDRGYRCAANLHVEGSGCGLWIARTIVEKEGGRIEVQNNPGGGALFHLRIPVFRLKDWEKGLDDLSDWFRMDRGRIVAMAKTVRTMLQLQHPGLGDEMESIVFSNMVDHLRKLNEARAREIIDVRLAALKTKNPNGVPVLIVDDSLFVQNYLGTYLTDLGYRIVDFATNGHEGVSLYNVQKPRFVTMDFTMPFMSGIEASVKIVEADPAARILFITGLGEYPPMLERLRTSLLQENYRIITKPVRKEILKAAVDDLLR